MGKLILLWHSNSLIIMLNSIKMCPVDGMFVSPLPQIQMLKS